MPTPQEHKPRRQPHKKLKGSKKAPKNSKNIRGYLRENNKRPNLEVNVILEKNSSKTGSLGKRRELMEEQKDPK